MLKKVLFKVSLLTAAFVIWTFVYFYVKHAIMNQLKVISWNCDEYRKENDYRYFVRIPFKEVIKNVVIILFKYVYDITIAESFYIVIFTFRNDCRIYFLVSNFWCAVKLNSISNLAVINSNDVMSHFIMVSATTIYDYY